MNLIIVESPVKSKTIQRFLGKEYEVKSSYGHIRDLPKGKLGVDIENDFEPKYVIPTKSRKVINLLKSEAQKSQLTILATDEDREGEAIAWHLAEVLNLNGEKPYQRIVFHEITKRAIETALKNPRKIDMKLVNAQQARRILDRLVGYKLSPFLWKKISRGLSAGRVQSVAVRLIVEREKEIENFTPEEYWTVVALLFKDKGKEFEATLVKKDGKIIPKLGIKNKKEADRIVKELKGAEYKIENIEKKEVKRNPLPPFTTSTLQQTAWQRFRLPAKFTMRIAQQLYERGLTSYHRTDSLNLSDSSLFAAKKFIIENYGKDYWAGFLRRYKAKGRVQEAHEAIRPTYPNKTPEDLKLKAKLDDNLFRLYDLIWRRFIACQMSQAHFDSTTVDIEAKNYIFRANGSILKFDGFLKVYPIKYEEMELPFLEKNEILDLKELIPSQHFTQPPPRYSEATLIKTLEKEGIGRPSTYAPILDTIQLRNYVRKNEKKQLEPTEIGTLVNNLLVKHFPKIVDIKFTANMEEDLDRIAQGSTTWVPVIKDFYEPFKENLKKKYEEVSKKEITEEKTEKTCPKCGKPLVIKLGRFGKFLACSNFPNCKYTEPLGEEKKLKEKYSGLLCDKCGSPMVVKHGKFGAFLACSNYPKCKNIKSIEKSTGIKCPKCKKGEIVEKRTKKGTVFYGCNQFPKCDFALWDKPLPGKKAGTGETCPKCGSLLVETKRKQIYPVKSSEAGAKQFNRVKCSNKDCNYVEK